MLTINEIMKLLPHRYPMLLIDRILEIEGDQRIVGLKNVTVNEQFFQGHFPGSPVMPGVLIIEALAQCGAVLCTRQVPDRERKLFYFGGIDKARFRKPVIPGDQLILEVTLIQRRANTARLKGVARVGDNLVAEAELLSVMVDRQE
ncbi:MAG TPA: 3-hydroxyacyl-ACP dehydratase FabZ [Thermoanaerobaculia bacterium]|nr:3-hydroxyacyl-ACP dehydratase FabZ [Thermoanaerobaculia bacterium]